MNTKTTPPQARKDLSADALIATLHATFSQISDHRKGAKIAINDAVMAAFAMFSLKDPSLLAFDRRRLEHDKNLIDIFKIKNVPCDTQMRDIIDKISPDAFSCAYKNIFNKVEQNNELSKFKYINGCYLLSIDGTGYFSSSKLNSDACMTKKNSKTGKVTYHQQLLGGSIVHPRFKEVIPLMPEMIRKQDGQKKNDCERNAAKRFLKRLREDHPDTPFIVIEDSLSSNAPHIRELKSHNLNFILGVKPGDHEFLFAHVASAYQEGKIVEFDCIDREKSNITHRFRFINNIQLNASNPDIRVNFIEYQESGPKKSTTFSWITNIELTKKNVFKIMKAARARWKIENETFNTLKNQGYNLEHNYGVGKENLSENFAYLTVLAFLVDQVQQLCCRLFNAVFKKFKSKKYLWEQVRIIFNSFIFKSMEELHTALFVGVRKKPPELMY